MPNAAAQKKLPNINTVDIRYRGTRQPIKCSLHLHFADVLDRLEQLGGVSNDAKLIAYMGITPNRWEQLKQGAAPTLAEAAAYAEYMNISITDLYKIIPYNKNKKA